MSELIKRIRNKAVYPIAWSLFLCGCGTTTRSAYKIEQLPQQKIAFSQQNARTLDDMINVSENFNETIKFDDRFDIIKQRIKRDINYNPHNDIIRLVSDIEKSDLKNKNILANQIKSFGYYRFERVREKSFSLKRGWTGPLTILAGLYGIYYTLQAEEMDEWYQKLGGIGLSGCGVVIGWGVGKENMNTKYSYDRVYYNPYYGTSRIIKKNVGEPR